MQALSVASTEATTRTSVDLATVVTTLPTPPLPLTLPVPDADLTEVPELMEATGGGEEMMVMVIPSLSRSLTTATEQLANLDFQKIFSFPLSL